MPAIALSASSLVLNLILPSARMVLAKNHSERDKDGVYVNRYS